MRLRDESARALHASEHLVVRSFNHARLVATLAAGLLLVGFLLVAQMRGQATLAGSLERQSDQDLAIIIEQLTAENNVLRGEVSLLESRLREAGRATEDRARLLNDAARELNALQAIAGLEPAVGPGIVVTISDPERVILPEDIVRVVHELRSGGAEALAVNGVRVTATSGVTMRDGRIELDGTPLAREFEVSAIGTPSDLAQALSLPGGLRSTLSTFPGVTVGVRESEELAVPAGTEHGFVLGVPVEDAR
ncbi:MAG TPA: DUF881 domain-containing protein [Coriobacteriia bacterium]|nr:DUF881 domain-containing protein [Coriobacteriia bacterium]